MFLRHKQIFMLSWVSGGLNLSEQSRKDHSSGSLVHVQAKLRQIWTDGVKLKDEKRYRNMMEIWHLCLFLTLIEGCSVSSSLHRSDVCTCCRVSSPQWKRFGFIDRPTFPAQLLVFLIFRLSFEILVSFHSAFLSAHWKQAENQLGVNTFTSPTVKKKMTKGHLQAVMCCNGNWHSKMRSPAYHW